MQDSTLIRTLQLLTPEEFDTLEQFVASPIFNEVHRFNDTVRLFDYIKTYYPDLQDPALDKKRTGEALYPKRGNPANEVERTMTQLLHIVRQFINFRYTAVKGGRVVRGGRKTSFLHDPVALLNFARQQLALMRFYSERLHVKPSDAAKSGPEKPGEPADPETGKKKRAKRTENFFQNLYQEIEEVFDTQQQFQHFEEFEYSDFFYYRFLSEQEKTLYESVHEWSAQSGFLSLLATSEKLDRFFLLAKLDQICKLLHLQQIAVPFDEATDEYRRLITNQTVTAKMVKLLTKNSYHADDPGIDIYFTLLKLLTKKKVEKTDAIADRFFDLLQQHQDQLPAKRFQDFHVIVRSYWARRYRQTRDRRFLERQFHSHQKDVELLAANNEKVQSSHFQNMLFNAIKLGQLEWAEALLTRLAGHIAGTPEPDMVADIGYAMLRFAQGRYEEAGRCLPHYIIYGGLDDVNLYLLAATLDLRIRYELDSLLDEESVNMKRATQKRIRENKTIRPQRKEGVLAFYEHVIHLFRQKERLQLRGLNCAAIRKELEKTAETLQIQPAVDSEWLQEKLAALHRQLDQKCAKIENR